jgi:DNA polymerase III delta prime subunit
MKIKDTEIRDNGLYMQSQYSVSQQSSYNVPILPVYEHIRAKISYFLTSKKVPHIIFHGPSGTGKRTIVYDLLNRIYNYDKHLIKTNVMLVNCAHGKGIKFIREDIKFFAKTNIQTNSGVDFKTIVLLNADLLTLDAQSALRRCIEQFSSNTRFIIIVENKHKLLNPIISRFCEIYVPEYIDENQRVLNLHQYNLEKIIDIREHNNEKQQWIKSRINGIMVSNINYPVLVNMSVEFYEKGISCLDLVEFIENTDIWSEIDKIKYIMMFSKIKSEYRCEKLLLLTMFDKMFENIVE